MGMQMGAMVDQFSFYLGFVAHELPLQNVLQRGRSERKIWCLVFPDAEVHIALAHIFASSWSCPTGRVAIAIFSNRSGVPVALHCAGMTFPSIGTDPHLK